MNMYEDGLDGEEYDGLQHFQLNVIILEARHLSMINSDTKVVVSIGKRNKILRSKTTKTDAPYFNELCIFNFYLPLSVLLDEILQIKLYGVPKLKRNRLVGSFNVELATVWFQPNHQFYHKWAALTDPKNPAGGVKGYLKCDIALLSQGTKSKPTDRDPAENIEDHMLVPFGEISDRQRARFVFSLFRADNFSNYFASDPLRTLYAYVRITYAGLTGKTTVVSGTFNPSWNQEIAFDDMIPALCQYVHIEICDALKATSRGILGTANLDLRKLSHESDKGFLPTYGPSFLYLYQNFAKLDKHNKCGYVSSSFTYMCRLLMALRTEVVDYAEDVLAKKKSVPAIKPKSIPPLDESKYFKYSEFIFFAAVFDVLLFDTSIITNRVSFRVNIGPDKPAANDDIFRSTINIKPSLRRASEDEDEDGKSSTRTKKTVTFEDEQLKKSEMLITGITADKDDRASDDDDKKTSGEGSGKHKFKFKEWKSKGLQHLHITGRQGEHGPRKFDKRKIYNDTRSWKPLRQLRYWPNEFRGKRKSKSDGEATQEKKPIKRMKLERLIKNFKPYQKLNIFKKSNHQDEKKDGTSRGTGQSPKKSDSGAEDIAGGSGSSATSIVAPVLVTTSRNNEKYLETPTLERTLHFPEEIPQEKEKFDPSEQLPPSRERHLKRTLQERFDEGVAKKEGNSQTPSEVSTHEEEDDTNRVDTFPKGFFNKVETVACGWTEIRKKSDQPESQSDTGSTIERLKKKLTWSRANTQKHKFTAWKARHFGSWTSDCKPNKISESEITSESEKDSLISRKRKLFKKWSEEWKRKRRERLEQASSTSGTTGSIRSKFREWRQHHSSTDWRAIRRKGKTSESDGTERRTFDRIKKVVTSPRDWKIKKKRKYLRYWPTDWKTVKKASSTAKGNKRRSLRRIGLINLRKECFKKPVTKTDEPSILSGTEEKTELPSTSQADEEPESVTVSSSFSYETFFKSGDCAKRSGSQEALWSEKTVWQEQPNSEESSYDSLLERGEKEWQKMKKGSTDFPEEFREISETDTGPRFDEGNHEELGNIGVIEKEEDSSSLNESDTSTVSSYESHLEDQKNLHSSVSSQSKKRVQFTDELEEVISESEILSTSSTDFSDDTSKQKESLKRKEMNHADVPEPETDKKRLSKKDSKYVFSPENTTDNNVLTYFALKKRFPAVSFPPRTSILAYYSKTETTNKFNFFKKKRKPEHVFQLLLSGNGNDERDEEYEKELEKKLETQRLLLEDKREPQMKRELIYKQKNVKDVEGPDDEAPTGKDLDEEGKNKNLNYVEGEEFPDLDKNGKIASKVGERKKRKGLPKSEKMNTIEIRAANDKTEDGDFEKEELEINPVHKKRMTLERRTDSIELRKRSGLSRKYGKTEKQKEESFYDWEDDEDEEEFKRKDNKFGPKKEKGSAWEEPIKLKTKSKDAKTSEEFPHVLAVKDKGAENFDKTQRKISRSKEVLEEDEKEPGMVYKLKRDWSLMTLKESFKEKKSNNKIIPLTYPEESKRHEELNDLSEHDIHQLKDVDDRLRNRDQRRGPRSRERMIQHKDEGIKDSKKGAMFLSKKPRQASLVKMDQTRGASVQDFPDDNEPAIVSANEVKHVRIYNGCNTSASKPVTVRQNYGFANFSGSYPCIHLNGEWPDALRRLYRSNIVQKSVMKFKKGLAEVENDVISENRMEASEKLKKIYNDLSEDCQNILNLTNKIEPEDTNLYRERKRYYHGELKEIIQKAETASKKKVLIAEDELKRANTYLTTLVRYAQDPEDSFPDTEIWLVKDGISVAQHRMKTQKIVFSPNMNERGIHSGKIQSIIARGREGQEVAKIDIFMWFGSGNHFAECKRLLPPGFQSEPHKCPGTVVWDVPLLLSYTEEHYFKCRIHLFQARILVGADVTGLADPFVRATVLTQFKESQIQKETLNPTWDETLVFPKLMIHGPADYIKNNSLTITIEVIDYDFMSKNELIGRALLKPVVWLHDEEYKPPKLTWEEIRKECSETGKILLAAEMWEVSKDEPEEPRKQEKIPIPESVRPVSAGHRLEVLFWGVRELRRKSPRTMKVFVTLECGGKYLTSPVLKNANKNLNFPGTVQTLDLELPEEHEYKPPLIMKLFQTGTFVLGRETYSGNCIIPSVKAFFSAAVDDVEKKRNEISFKELLAEVKQAKKAEEEEALVLEEAQRRKDKWKRLKTKFKAILESFAAFFVKIFKKIKCKIRRSCADIDRSNMIEYEEDETLDWWVKYYASREHRQDSPDTETLVIYEEELEAQPEFRGFSDFIYTFDLVTGKGKKGSGNQISVGKVKAAIKLYRWPLEDGSHHTLCGVDIRKGVLKQLPSNAAIKYVVRVYVVSCKNLTPKDLYGKSDPYLILQIGNQRINDEKNYIPKQVNPIFGKCFEFKGTFPKEHLLRIKVMDHDIFSEDDLIGETLIDLESRYYTKHHASCGLPKTYSRTGYTAWRDAYRPTEILKTVCKQSNMENPVYTDNSVRIGEYEFHGVITNTKHQMEMHALAALKKWHEIPLHGFHLVPEHVETRALYHPSFPGVEQGKIEMWIDIFPADFRYVPPIVDIEPRKPVAMELRAIVWNVEGVILNDTTLFFNEKMSDIYVQGWLNALEGDKQVTDVHYRSMNGEGNFNWRFIFPFKYIASERRLVVFKKQNVFDTEPEEMKFPCKLELQVWDNDFFSDDFLGSLNLELCSMPRGAKISTTCKLSMFEETTPKINLFKIRRTRGWWPFRRIVDAESSEYSLTGKIDLELEVMTEKEAEENPVGKAREEPKALPEPKRPESSFIWFLNPFKTFKYIICKKYGKTLIILLIVAMLVTFLLLGIYSFPGYTVKRILGA